MAIIGLVEDKIFYKFQMNFSENYPVIINRNSKIELNLKGVPLWQ